jgi:hypothetical protein
VTARKRAKAASVAGKRVAPSKTGTAETLVRKRTSPANTATLETVGAKTVAAERGAGKLTVLTIGHSTRTIEEFVGMLRAHGVERLVDVRSIPKSRRVPQFNSDALAAALRKEGIEYLHMKSLGGLRHAKKDSANLGWRNASFRGYADYMATEEFRASIARLLELAREQRTAIMCAEAVPWRCHRSLIGDALLIRGVNVEDIMTATSTRPHELTPFARVEGLDISYPADTEQGTLPLS